MKKKLLSLFIALVAILSISFTFTACDKDSKGKMTEEEWIEALNNSYSATNHSTHSSTTENGETVTVKDWAIDYPNSVIYINQSLYLPNGTVFQSTECYFERNGKTFKTFGNENNIWYLGEIEFTSEEEAESYFLMFGIAELGEYTFGGTGEHEGQEASLVEMYDWFNYDAEKDIYTAQISSIGLDSFLQRSTVSEKVDEGIVTLKFVGGKLVYFAQEYTQEGSTYTEIYEIEYGTVVTIPEEVRNNAQERE